jgi:predicted TIM-barrel fold metal-dependent hydrolase
MRIFDIHAHAFPDFLAPKAIGALEKSSGCKAESDGTASGLLALMDRHGVERAAVVSIATRPEQAKAIVDWSLSLDRERLVPFASVHPRSKDIEGDVQRIVEAGLKGVKMHPLYQEFYVDDPEVFPLYEALEAAGLPMLCHTGLDISFGEDDHASPARFEVVMERFPKLTIVMAHFGGWKRLDLFIERLCGRDVYIDTSYTLGFVSPKQVETILEKHGPDRILFGSDSPWGYLAGQIGFVQDMPLSEQDKEKIFWGNAERLLGLG